MDYLRQGIHLRGSAQKDPKQEYKREAFEMFTSLLDEIKYEVIGILFKVQVKQEEDVQVIDEQMQMPKEMHFEHASASALAVDEQDSPLFDNEDGAAIDPLLSDKIGRNDPCPCGSGQKFKQCHGKLS
jgi:preprotein translocase subunit SecA